VASERWEFLRSEVVHENTYFRVLESAVSRPDGTTADYHTIDFRRPAVSVLLQDAAGRILLIRQHRFIVDREVWALPSGGVDEGERPETAAGRELTEETGYRAGRIEHLLSYYPSYGVSNQVFHCILALDPTAAAAPPDENEDQRVAWFSLDEVRAKILDGEVPDGFSLTPLLHWFAGLSPQLPSEARRCRRVVPACLSRDRRAPTPPLHELRAAAPDRPQDGVDHELGSHGILEGGGDRCGVVGEHRRQEGTILLDEHVAALHRPVRAT
jgi:8-oxo-dGTP pyrophosphatase MutT (NUDIX family)